VRLEDDDAALNLVLGQTHHLLGEAGDFHARRLVQHATLRLWRDGAYFNPIPGDNWTDPTYEAVLCVRPDLIPEFTSEVLDRIWSQLDPVLKGRGRIDVFSVRVEAIVPPLPEVGEDWRKRTAEVADAAVASNQGRRERERGGFPERDGLVLGSRAEAVVFDLLVELQRDLPSIGTIAIAPVPGVRLRDSGVRTPDFLVVGNSRAVVIEVDDPSHYRTTRRADDADRDRQWNRCGVPTVRIGSHHADDPDSLRGLLKEELHRHLWPR
jgi:hypothetical protein